MEDACKNSSAKPVLPLIISRSLVFHFCVNGCVWVWTAEALFVTSTMLWDGIVICKDISSCQAFCIFMFKSSSRCFFIPLADVTCATRVPSGGVLIPLNLLRIHTT
jgi:hypothetical protein